MSGRRCAFATNRSWRDEGNGRAAMLRCRAGKAGQRRAGGGYDYSFAADITG